MGLESLYLFTLLGGMAAGAYAFEAALCRKREGARPWLVPLVVVILFAAGTIAAATHVNIGRAFEVAFGGTVNFASGMVQEVAVAALFLVLAVVDLIVTFVKKGSPYALRVVTAIVGAACLVMMGAAYIGVAGNPVWCNAPATILSLVAGNLAMGLALYAALSATSYANKPLLYTSIVVNVVLAVGLGLEIAAFGAEGLDALAQIAGLIIAPIASIVLALVSSKIKNEKAVAIAICAVSVIGVAVARYAFYATAALV